MRFHCALLLAIGCAALTGAANAQCVPSPSGLVGWWTGDGTAEDLAGTSNGTPFNGASYGPGSVISGGGLTFVDDHQNPQESDHLSRFLSVPACGS